MSHLMYLGSDISYRENQDIEKKLNRFKYTEEDTERDTAEVL